MDHPPYNKVLCIGAGSAGICLGAQLKLQLGDIGDDIHIYERNEDIGGTWTLNTYPGQCSLGACASTSLMAANRLRMRHSKPILQLLFRA